MKTIIIGAGPASLMAATQAVKNGNEVIVFEKMKTAGRKFLVAGDGGFNLTHEGSLDDFSSYYSHSQIADIIRQFTNDDLVAWLKELEIDTYVGSSGKIFPAKGIKPAFILKTWLNLLKNKGVKFVFNASLIDFSSDEVVITSNTVFEKHQFDHLILGLGAASWPKTGSDAAWVSLFKTKQIEIVPFQASNAGINCLLPTEFLQKFHGQIFKNVIVSHQISKRKGEVVLTNYGVEGAPIYYLNPSIRSNIAFPIVIDFKPDFSENEIVAILKNAANISEGLKKLKIPNPIIFWCKSYLTKEDYNSLHYLAKLLKSFLIEPISFRPIEEAISCCGGVSWNELDENLRLINYPKISVVGEMIDWDAPTGGYLLQACFSSGFVATQVKC
jgi:uncharacterized flavoprotein (TIGR03862 family)